MAEDWDLFAIVRSCQSATNTTTTENSFTTTNTIPSSISTSNFNVELEYDAFSFPNVVQPITNELQGLNQLLTSFTPTTTTTTSGHGINPNSPPHIAKYIGQQHHHFVPTTSSSIWPHFVQETSTSSFNKFNNQQLQQQHNQLQAIQKQEFQVPQSIQPQTPRSRKRWYKFFQFPLIIEYFISLLK